MANPVRDFFGMLAGVARDVSTVLEEVGALVERLDNATCSVCRIPTRPEQQCPEGACGDCCTRTHNHNSNNRNERRT
jgi:hypothetical protein